MQVNGPNTAGAPAKADGAARSGLDLGYDAFIKLLLAQLKNQDPTKPMDATQYVSQLATLSNLEQVIKHNDKLDALLRRTAYDQGAAILGMQIDDRAGGVSGVVVAVEILSDGVRATLDNGAKVLVGEGISIRQP